MPFLEVENQITVCFFYFIVKEGIELAINIDF